MSDTPDNGAVEFVLGFATAIMVVAAITMIMEAVR